MLSLLVLVVSLGGCAASSVESSNRPNPGHCPLADYRTMVEQLAGDSGGQYATGSAENFQAMRYLEGHFQAAGLVPGGEAGGFRQCFDVANHERACNVVGIVPGVGSLTEEAVIIAAHFDRHPTGSPVRDATAGADDNASAAAGLVALARMLSRPTFSAPRRTLVLVALNGSQQGRGGLDRYLERPVVSLAKTRLAIVMHRIGRLHKALSVTVTGVAPERSRWLSQGHASKLPVVLKSATHKASHLPSAACSCDDAKPLAARGVPTMTVTTGDSPNAGPGGDSTDTINWVGARRVLDHLASTAHREIYAL